MFDAEYISPGVTQRTALFTMPAVALVAGASFGWLARRQGQGTVTIALAGLPGPALLTMAYLIAGPGSGAAHYQVVPYWAAMTASGAGVLGSGDGGKVSLGAGEGQGTVGNEVGDTGSKRSSKQKSSTIHSGSSHEPSVPCPVIRSTAVTPPG